MSIDAPVQHGTPDAYVNRGRRCSECKTFMAEYRRSKREAAEEPEEPSDAA